MADIFKVKRGRKSTLHDINPVLQEGEIVFEKLDDGTTGYGTIKMGDGITHYNQLPPFLQAVTDYIPLSQKGHKDGVAPLNAQGKVPVENLPASLDDILEYPSKADFPDPGEEGKLYVDTSEITNNLYRWSGTQYVSVSSSVTYTLVKEGSSVILKCSDGTRSTVSNVGGVEIRDTEPSPTELYSGKMWIVR